MAALGSLKELVRRFVVCRTASAMRCLNVHNVQSVQIIGMRQMSGGGHKRVMIIKPSNFETKRWLDHLNFYFWLGAIPSLIIIWTVNLFIGPAELVDTPEGYEPYHWEYFKHPITRFHARYIQESPQKIYERHMHFLNKQQEQIMIKKLRRKVEYLSGDVTGRYDSTYWYYQPAEDRIPAYTAGNVARDRHEEGAYWEFK